MNRNNDDLTCSFVIGNRYYQSTVFILLKFRDIFNSTLSFSWPVKSIECSTCMGQLKYKGYLCVTIKCQQMATHSAQCQTNEILMHSLILSHFCGLSVCLPVIEYTKIKLIPTLIHPLDLGLPLKLDKQLFLNQTAQI